MTAIYSDRLRGISTAVAIKAPVRVATTENITLSGLQSVDGVTLIDGDRVLVKDQADAEQNGVWVAGDDAWSRALDFNDGQDIVRGTQVLALEGAASAGITYLLDTVDAIIGSSSLAFTISQRGAPGDDGLEAFIGRDNLVTAISSGDLDHLIDGKVVWFAKGNHIAAFAKVTGSTAISDMPGYEPLGRASTIHWGAGLGSDASVNDTSRVQEAINFLAPLNRTLWIEGDVFIHSAVTIPGMPRIRSASWSHRIIQVEGNFPVFDVVTSGATPLKTGQVKGIRAVANAVSTGADNAFMRFGGVADAIITQCDVSDNHLANFNNGFIYNIPSRSTSHGLEGGVNWSTFSGNVYENVTVGHLVKTGTGTGNVWIGEKPRIRQGGAYIHVDPAAPNTVAGDMIITNAQGNGVGGEATFFKVETGTVYGAQITISNNQFDANMQVPVDLATDFSFENLTMSGNNWGGGTTFGEDIEPVRTSVIQARDVSRWEVGNVRTSTAAGARIVPLFDVQIPAGGALFSVEITAGDIPGIGAAYAAGEYWVTQDAGGAVVTERSKEQSSGAAGALDISFVSTASDTARVRALYTQTAGTARVHGNMRGRGESAFKIVRVTS